MKIAKHILICLCLTGCELPLYEVGVKPENPQKLVGRNINDLKNEYWIDEKANKYYLKYLSYYIHSNYRTDYTYIPTRSCSAIGCSAASVVAYNSYYERIPQAQLTHHHYEIYEREVYELQLNEEEVRKIILLPKYHDQVIESMKWLDNYIRREHNNLLFLPLPKTEQSINIQINHK